MAREAIGQVRNAQTVLKPVVASAGKDVVRQAQLLQSAQPLEVPAVDHVDHVRVQSKRTVHWIIQDLRSVGCRAQAYELEGERRETCGGGMQECDGRVPFHDEREPAWAAVL